MRPGERKTFRIDNSASCTPCEGGMVNGNEDSETKSLDLMSKVRTLSSPMAKQLMTDLGPRRPTLTTYWRDDWS